MNHNHTRGTGHWIQQGVCFDFLFKMMSHSFVFLHSSPPFVPCVKFNYDFVVLNGWKVCFDVMSAVERQSFCCNIHLLSLQFSPKLISPGPCPLACSVNKGLVLVRPLLYTQGGWSDHSSLLSAIERQKPGQCLPQQTCGTAFTNFN